MISRYRKYDARKLLSRDHVRPLKVVEVVWSQKLNLANGGGGNVSRNKADYFDWRR